MSKIKKKRVDRATTTISRKEIEFEKILQFTGWFFLLAFSVYLGIYVVFDYLFKTIEMEIGAMQYSFIIFMGTSAALSFALVTKIRKNRDKKKEIFIDWLIGEFFFCMFAILVIAVYQW